MNTILIFFWQIHRPPDPAAFPDLRASQLPQLSGLSGHGRPVHGVMQHGRKFITSVEIKRSVREWINWRIAVAADEEETWDTYRDTPPERDHPHIWRPSSMYRIPAAFLASFYNGPSQQPLSLSAWTSYVDGPKNQIEEKFHANSCRLWNHGGRLWS